MYTYKFIFREHTDDQGIKRAIRARDNNALYVVTSAHAKDMISSYMYKHGRPSAAWLNRHFSFYRIDAKTEREALSDW